MKLTIVALALCVAAVQAWLPLPEAVRNRDAARASRAAPIANCGVSAVGYDGPKIVGGRNAQRGEFPWQISLQRGSASSSSHSCGGSILNANYIITAAHCVTGTSAGNLRVIVGAHTLNAAVSGQQNLAVAQIIVHPSYSSSTLNNDIALLRLSTAITLDQYKTGVCLPSQGVDITGNVQVSGWGTTREGGSLANTLQVVEVPIITIAKCRSQYGTSSITANMICAGLDAGGKDSCQGDSGGPLVQKSGGKSTLYGVVSWGSGCARPNYAGVYTKLSNYVNWINSQ